jgi:putative molybdopterin biosynthesis protein
MNESASRDAAQQQFLTILPREEALARFKQALQVRALGVEMVGLAEALGRILAERIRSEVDTPPFDRSGVDGYAVRAADTRQASVTTPCELRLNDEVLSCGTTPRLMVHPGTATIISTGAPLPRGADAVVMVEQVETGANSTIRVTKPALAGQNMAYAGSDIARGQTVLEPGRRIGAAEIAMLAAIGRASIPVWRRPRVAVISTGDELRAPGTALGPAEIYDSNGPAIIATLTEAGCDPIDFGRLPDQSDRIASALREAHATSDAIILSGGTSKGAGDLTYRLINDLGAPGILAHGVSLKPGKPLCLAVCDGKPVVALPGFPTSAMFTLHDMIIPVFRLLAGLPAQDEVEIEASVPVRVPSEIGRKEFVMAQLLNQDGGLIAYPLGRGSGAVTAFAQADGFFSIDTLEDHLPAGAKVPVRLLSPRLRLPDLAIIGSHCLGLDEVTGLLTQQGLSVRVVPVGSLGGLQALKRGECDLAPIHLLDPVSGMYNRPMLTDALDLIAGWKRVQGVVFRKDDARFSDRDLARLSEQVVAAPDLLMINRNTGSGTRVLIDELLKGQRPAGYSNQPRSHHAVSAAIAAGRADWGVAIEPVARLFGLDFIPIADEDYDFAVARNPRNPHAIAAFRAALHAARHAVRDLGFTPVEG